ncbi:hypothetical protein C1924_11915 [Stenotrophomonas sp. ESTM1D_MKCIP4_1]|uniref:hypothetical protein n=1 Tax=Stenotrophomonas sp. ESTM1D_MKCIP4_1 TaxID=2072414 RepID=UPI000D53FD1C|nr:hypothetical protein [Stenotrophomonas sp. ESTM1D_MKCIP4_1]AWH55492.1 hypothetical protein C1924_11915 [Stenotrophomonas sp. ESTM1D_MKCIP4_1]
MHPSLNDRQIRILQTIAEADEVDSNDATWAVTAGLAVQAEDGDIDLTPRGHEVLRTQASR